MQPDERAALLELRELFRRIAGPGQLGPEGTFEATLASIEQTFNKVVEVLATTKPFTIVGANDGTPDRYLAVAGGLDHIEQPEFQDLVGQGVARVILLEPATLDMLAKPVLV